MKIILVGGTGTLGQAVLNELGQRHEVIIVSHHKSDITVDIEDLESIERMYQVIGKFDALIATVGNVHFGAFEEIKVEDFFIGIKSKLMGQVNLVMKGLRHINDHGSFTLTSGILSDDPIRFGASASMINAALDGFVKGAAIEMPCAVRINAVSPTIVRESLAQYGEYFLGFPAVSAKRVALAYSKSAEGSQTGQIYRVWE